MKASLQEIPIDDIKSNPHRDLKSYPFMPEKLKALQHSITSLGELWEGLIVRPHPLLKGEYQLAFGHHRWKASKEAGLKKLRVIVRDLSDEQMLQFMGRENMEDYRSEFLIMLETWEAAAKFARPGAQKTQASGIAELLGWTRLDSRPGRTMHISETAQACAAASELITGGWINREDLSGISVKDAREICQRAKVRMEQVETAGKTVHATKTQVDAVKRDVSRAVKSVAGDAREGLISSRALGGEVDAKAYRYSREAKRKTPLLLPFLTSLCGQIEGMLNDDAASQKIAEVIKVVADIERTEDKQGVERLVWELGKLSERAIDKQSAVNKQMTKTAGRKTKVVTPEFKQISNG